jgi:hypothetical protein
VGWHVTGLGSETADRIYYSHLCTFYMDAVSSGDGTGNLLRVKVGQVAKWCTDSLGRLLVIG